MAGRDPRTSPRILGITGPIGCGKTTVGNILLEFGALERIDADEIVHQLMAPGTETSQRVSAAFGLNILRPDGAVDRARLGDVVFGHAGKLQLLESIVHPEVRRAIRRRIEALRGAHGVVIIDAVKLLQSDLIGLVDEVWVIRCSSQSQIDRLTRQRGMALASAQVRLRAQPSFSGPRVDHIIENSGSMDELRARVRLLWNALSAGKS